MGAFVGFGGGVDGQQHTQHCSVGEVTHTLHGEGQHHLYSSQDVSTSAKERISETHAAIMHIDI